MQHAEKVHDLFNETKEVNKGKTVGKDGGMFIYIENVRIRGKTYKTKQKTQQAQKIVAIMVNTEVT